MDDLTIGQNNEPSIDSLGTRLRKAREYKGLGVDSVAHQLNLSQQRVLDMENDDYRFAVAESYAKGFLRAYAKLLGLDPDLIILEFDRQNFSHNIQHHETKLIIKRQVSSGDRWMRWLTYSIGLLLVFLVAIWWRSQPNSAETGVISADSSDQSTTDISAQATRKADAAEHQTQPSQNLGEEAGLLQKPELTPAQIVQDPTQDASQKIETPVQAQAQPQPQKVENTPPSTPSSTDKTPIAQTPAAASAPAARSKPPLTTAQKPSADDDSDNDSDDDDSDDDDSSNVQGFNMIKRLKPLKPGVIVGQREQEERALLLELEKVFGRG